MKSMTGKFRCLLAGVLCLSAPLANAALVTYSTVLSGAAESPANASGGTGSATLLIDTIANMMTLDMSFSGLTGTTTAAHIHCCTAAAGAGTAGVATQIPYFVGFPTGVTAGSYHADFDLADAASWNPTYVGNNGGTPLLAAQALIAGLDAERAYLNIHTSTFGGGEIRGFLVREVPEPGSLTLLGLAAGCALGLRRRRTG